VSDGGFRAIEGELALEPGDVHVFQFDLAAVAAAAPSLRRLLAPDELARASRFRFDRHRDAFIGARAALRLILGRFAGRRAAALRFVYGEHGKPSLALDDGGAWLRFNLSHAHERALVAVTRDREVGVDVEHIRPDMTGEDIWERFFSERERAALRALPEAERPRAFFQCWTRKEAYIKAAGPGLSIPLDSFDVTLGPGVPARLLATRPDAAEAARWSLEALEPGAGYEGAVVVEGGAPRLTRWEWEISDTD
jgi:4'-phosphopantetheinyl transferase